MIKISEAEHEIMKILWRYDKPISAYEIRQELKNLKGWERTTVLTLIRRLVKKGAIKQDKREIYYYTSKISEQEFMQEETQSFIKRIYNGNSKNLIAALFQNKDITNNDIDELKKFFNDNSKNDEA